MYLSTKPIESLQEFSAKERILLVHNAGKLMPFARRAYATTIKAIILIAVFWSILYVPGIALKIVAILAAGILYPIVLFPISLNLAVPYLPEAIRQYKASRELAKGEPADRDSDQAEAEND